MPPYRHASVTAPINEGPSITFTPEKFKRFKEAYLEACGEKSFFFEGHEVLTIYAKYLIVYLALAFDLEE